MKTNQYERAYQTWGILTNLADRKRTITYKALGDLLNIHHRVVKWPLHLIQEHCLEAGLPGLSVLVISRSGVVGQGFVAYSRDRIAEGKKEVLDYDWKSLQNPFTFAATGESFQSLVDDILEKPEERPVVYTKVKSRGMAQRLFRDALLDAYKGRCAMSGSSMTEVLEAAHIVPWSELDEAERLNPQNGLLLNVLYHRLFDNGILTLDESFTVRLGADVKLDELSEFDRGCLETVIDKRIKMPKHKDYFPGKDFIKWRLENY